MKGLATLSVLGLIGVCIIAILQSCSPATTTVIQGDRSLVQVTVGKIKATDGDSRAFYILRDPDTGADYLAVVDAGIIELKPKPTPKLEKQ